MRAALLIVFAVVALAAAYTLAAQRQGPAGPVCYRATTEDSKPTETPCDYRHGGWHPVTPTVTLPACDDNRPGQPVAGPCWLADGNQVAVYPRPHGTPLYILAGAK